MLAPVLVFGRSTWPTGKRHAAQTTHEQSRLTRCRYPEADVIGFDLSNIQPAWVPPNCRFEVDDAEQAWTYAAGTYDLVHVRNLAHAVHSIPALLAQAFRTLAPGGWLEHAETEPQIYSDDGSLSASNPARRWFDLFQDAMDRSGRPRHYADGMERDLKAAGFVDVQVVRRKLPFGPWPKDPVLKRVGAMVLLSCESGMEAYSQQLFTKVLGMDLDEASKIASDGFMALKARTSHIYSYK